MTARSAGFWSQRTQYVASKGWLIAQAAGAAGATAEAPMRCVDAAVGGGVAIVAATLIPRAALRSPLDHVADEGLSAVRTSPFHRREPSSVRRVAELVEPLDLALRNTRVLGRRVTVAAVTQEPLPQRCATHCTTLAGLVDDLARWLLEPGNADPQPDLISISRELVLTATATQAEIVVSAQLRSVIADLLRLTGMTGLESTHAIGTRPA